MLTQEASLEVSKMINLIINRTSGDPSYLRMTPACRQRQGCLAGDLMSLPFLNIFKMLRTRDDVKLNVISLSVNANFNNSG
jgi:hypothetical protein